MWEITKEIIQENINQGDNMGKGMKPKGGYNQEKYEKGYSQIKWNTNKEKDKCNKSSK